MLWSRCVLIDQECGTNLYDQVGSFQSSSYPASYGSREECFYLIRSHGAHVINFTIEDFNTELNKDVLEYGYGDTVDIRNVEGLYQGNIITPVEFSVSGSSAWFFFSTDRNIQLKGFRISVSAGECHFIPITWQMNHNFYSEKKRIHKFKKSSAGELSLTVPQWLISDFVYIHLDLFFTNL